MDDQNPIAALLADDEPTAAPVEQPAPADPTPPPPEAASAPAEPVTDEAGRLRDPTTGKFAPKPAETPAAPQTNAPPAEASADPRTPPPGFVPLAAVHETREQLAAVRAELAALRAGQQPAPPPEDGQPEPQAKPQPYRPAAQTLPIERPDPEVEPEAARQWDEVQQHLQEVNADRWQERVYHDRRVCHAIHGADATKAAEDWALGQIQADEAFRQRLLAQTHPIEFIISAYQADQAQATLRDPDLIGVLSDPQARARLVAFLKGDGSGAPPATPSAPAPAPAPATPQPPPASIATATSAAGPGHVPVSPDAAFKALF